MLYLSCVLCQVDKFIAASVPYFCHCMTSCFIFLQMSTSAQNVRLVFPTRSVVTRWGPMSAGTCCSVQTGLNSTPEDPGNHWHLKAMNDLCPHNGCMD